MNLFFTACVAAAEGYLIFTPRRGVGLELSRNLRADCNGGAGVFVLIEAGFDPLLDYLFSRRLVDFIFATVRFCMRSYSELRAMLINCSALSCFAASSVLYLSSGVFCVLEAAERPLFRDLGCSAVELAAELVKY